MSATITIQKTTAGALFHVTGKDGVTRPYTCNDYEFKPGGDAASYSIVSKFQLEYIVVNQRYDLTINGDTGLAFASFSDLQTYIETYFFRKAGGGSGTLSATNFMIGVTPTGTINNSNTAFTLPDSPTLILGAYKNGLRLAPDEYSNTGTAFNYTVAPTTSPNDTLLIDYIK